MIARRNLMYALFGVRSGGSARNGCTMIDDTKPKTLLFVHASDEMYGSDFILLQLIKSLDRNRFRVLVVMPKDIQHPGLLSEALGRLGIEFCHLDLAVLRRKYFKPMRLPGFAWRLFTSTLALARLMRRESVDLVHTNTTAVMPSALAAWFAGRRHVWHVHEIITRPSWLRRFVGWLAPRVSDVVIAVSGPTKDNLCEVDGLNQTRCRVIHNGLDPEPFIRARGMGRSIREEWGIGTQEVLVGMVGRISHWKGQDYFLEAARWVAKSHPNARFALVGGTVSGEEHMLEKLQAKVRELRLSDRVVFSDFRRDIPSVLDAFDIFVLPSTLPDPLPTVVLEAMAAGKSVVANAHGGSVEMVDDQTTGFLVPLGEPLQMAAAIVRLFEDAHLRAAMGSAGRLRVLSHFSIEAFTSNWGRLYDELLDGERRRS